MIQSGRHSGKQVRHNKIDPDLLSAKSEKYFNYSSNHYLLFDFVFMKQNIT